MRDVPQCTCGYPWVREEEPWLHPRRFIFTHGPNPEARLTVQAADSREWEAAQASVDEWMERMVEYHARQVGRYEGQEEEAEAAGAVIH